mmetsp:Transcript_17780/g.51181  ORF Transcript_17780/g.51181 Transcript_17780/m.51181 type:complete len:222 (-) Transcript_17780:255-920(-)
MVHRRRRGAHRDLARHRAHREAGLGVFVCSAQGAEGGRPDLGYLVVAHELRLYLHTLRAHLALARRRAESQHGHGVAAQRRHLGVMGAVVGAAVVHAHRGPRLAGGGPAGARVHRELAAERPSLCSDGDSFRRRRARCVLAGGGAVRAPEPHAAGLLGPYMRRHWTSLVRGRQRRRLERMADAIATIHASEHSEVEPVPDSEVAWLAAHSAGHGLAARWAQ